MHAQTRQPTALVIQRRMVHYRVPFFEALRDCLASKGVTLRLAYGAPSSTEIRKNDSAEIPWAEKLPTRYFWRERICWQPFGQLLDEADIVVITAENKLAYNLVAQYLNTRCKVVLWGHGANLQGDPSSLSERCKRIISRQTDWWFGYTEMSRPLIRDCGFPDERITILNNSVDTGELASLLRSVSPDEQMQLKARLGLHGSHIGAFIGSLYEEKRIEFMLESAIRIREHLPDFEFLVVGAGPQEGLVRSHCAAHSWTRYLGELKGRQKAEILAVADIMINPGLVGLGILDSFVGEAPLVTTDCGIHSPEISYLRSGYNGLMTANSLEEYAAAVIELLGNTAELDRLRTGCKESAHEYSIKMMAQRFSEGLIRCLESPVNR